MLSRHEFSTPEEVVGLIDSSFRPELAADLERKRQTKSKVDAMAYKLDQVADWKTWSAPLGVKLMGLRVLVVHFSEGETKSGTHQVVGTDSRKPLQECICSAMSL